MAIGQPIALSPSRTRALSRVSPGNMRRHEKHEEQKLKLRNGGDC
jgi:hypothetical protein